MKVVRRRSYLSECYWSSSEHRKADRRRRARLVLHRGTSRFLSLPKCSNLRMIAEQGAKCRKTPLFRNLAASHIFTITWRFFGILGRRPQAKNQICRMTAGDLLVTSVLVGKDVGRLQGAWIQNAFGVWRATGQAAERPVSSKSLRLACANGTALYWQRP